MLRILLAAVISTLSIAASAGPMAQPVATEPAILDRLHVVLAAGGRSCKAVSSCEEAVQLWCSGYSRADADHDGIPCENVCSSKDQVDEIKGQIGC